MIYFLLLITVLAEMLYLNVVIQVEEKPDVTYSDVGGCKEQIEKLREVVEMPLLHVSYFTITYYNSSVELMAEDPEMKTISALFTGIREW